MTDIVHGANDRRHHRVAPEPARDDDWGLCPTCGKTDGYINVGRGHWFYCQEHKKKWFVGSNLFSSWKDETEDEQRASYAELGFGSYDRIDCTDAKKPAA